MPDFALVVFGRLALAQSGTVMTKAGEPFLVLNDLEGWVEATSTRHFERTNLPHDVKVWKDRAAVEEFAKRWKGHPWWCVPSRKYEVLELEPIMAVAGYKVKSPGDEPNSLAVDKALVRFHRKYAEREYESWFPIRPQGVPAAAPADDYAVLEEVVKWALAGHISESGVTVEAGNAIRAVARKSREQAIADVVGVRTCDGGAP